MYHKPGNFNLKRVIVILLSLFLFIPAQPAAAQSQGGATLIFLPLIEDQGPEVPVDSNVRVRITRTDGSTATTNGLIETGLCCETMRLWLLETATENIDITKRVEILEGNIWKQHILRDYDSFPGSTESGMVVIILDEDTLYEGIEIVRNQSLINEAGIVKTVFSDGSVGTILTIGSSLPVEGPVPAFQMQFSPVSDVTCTELRNNGLGGAAVQRYTHETGIAHEAYGQFYAFGACDEDDKPGFGHFYMFPAN